MMKEGQITQNEQSTQNKGLTQVKSCDRCKDPSVIFIRYSGAHLCGKHFGQYLEDRVRKSLNKQLRLPRDPTVVVGVSGGKDSMIALYLMKKILSNMGTPKIIAVTVDEGIEGYRPPSIDVVERTCKEWDIEHIVISFKDQYQFTMDNISPLDRDIGLCSYCGVFRRQCLNSVARDVGADALVTGLNLDDTAQSIMMNFVRGDTERLARMGPHKKTQPGLVPRMQPLRMIPEKECYLYAVLRDIEFHYSECPYSIEALRGTYRDIINSLEKNHPGTRHAIVRSYESMAEALAGTYPAAELFKCEKCGEPTIKSICKACVLKAEVVSKANKT